MSPIVHSHEAEYQSGQASWYGEEFRGRAMANGWPFDPDAMTCASWFYPLGTVLEVSVGDKRIRVMVTDHGPRYDLVKRGVVIDLSQKAFESLAPLVLGHVSVRIKKIDR